MNEFIFWIAPFPMSQHSEATMAVVAVDEAVAMVPIPMRTFLLRVLKKIGRNFGMIIARKGRGTG
jgi:hypothetical protein